MAVSKNRSSEKIIDTSRIESHAEIERKKDREMVKGIFRFHEIAGGVMSFPFRKHKGDPIEKFTLKDGETYTIPLGVAKHLNKECWYPSHSYKENEAGMPTMAISEKIRRCSFQSLEFVDIEDVPNVLG